MAEGAELVSGHAGQDCSDLLVVSMTLDPTQIMLLALLVSMGADKLFVGYLISLLARSSRAPAPQSAPYAGPAPAGPSAIPPDHGAIPPPVTTVPAEPGVVIPTPIVLTPPLPPPVVVAPPIVPSPVPLGPSKVLRGPCSYFGGPHDKGVAADEGLAVIERSDFGHGQFGGLFLSTQPEGTTGLARALNPDALYIACRWDYSETSKKYLQSIFVTVKNPVNGETAQARPVDWGPNAKTGRVADLSPGLMAKLGLKTDDVVEVDIPLPGSGPVVTGVPGVPAAVTPQVTPSAPVAGGTVLQHNTWPTQAEAMSFFGSPGSNLVKVTCPWELTVEGTKERTITINAKCAESLTRVLNYIWEKCGKSQDKIHDFGYDIFDGSYNPRNIGSTRTLSQHAWAGAMDWNAAANPQHATAANTKFKEDSLIVTAFKSEGWAWGGNWSPAYRDAMHFQLLRV